MISLTNVHLHYPLIKNHSLKSTLFQLKRKPKEETIHALKGITFSAKEGERIGILGRNGAGKSTFLRTVAGLYPISEGICKVEGEVRSLFELHLGFEWEATGRENIFYRGYLLGQTPSTMRALAKEIVRFADIGSFIDHPIRTYSSGMLVRLAFAISTFIPGDILLIDEVIGAGDAAFMQKATGKIKELISESKLVLLASHDLSALRNFCQRLLLFSQGEIIFDGDVEEGIQKYLSQP